MIETSVDIAVLGSGFGGSLMALILQRIGRSVVLVDRDTHPRFAIGESSTPIADYILGDLADRYDLPRLKPLAKYGSWRSTYPDIGCGLKRGFSYFRHESGRPFESDRDHSNELLVAASNENDFADTHWLRSDVDAFLADEARSAGIEVLDNTHLAEITHSNGWKLSGHRLDEPVVILARFVVDATGSGGLITRVLGIEDDSLQTNSRAVFGHFSGVDKWDDILAESECDRQEHPFPCDAAAIHHILDDAWMWQLRFDNGITSAGFVFDGTHRPWNESISAVYEWKQELAKYPSIARQFRHAELVQPDGGLRSTGRMQRCSRQMAGRDWGLLPNTAGFVDPLHSTGIAHTLSGIERIASIIERHWSRPDLESQLQQYAESLRNEIYWVDCLVEGCYASRQNFRAFAAWSMLYFAAATTCEHRRAESGSSAAPWSFLCADDDRLTAAAFRLRSELDQALTGSPALVANFEKQVRCAIEPFNLARLCDPNARNMYRSTASPAR
jgi:FADH2 O2-dependent halogenase